jgi:hypothetical protein
MGEMRYAFKILIMKSEGKRQLGRPRMRGCEVDSNGPGQGQWRVLMITVMNFGFHKMRGIF